MSTVVIRNVHLAYDDAEQAQALFDIALYDGKVLSITSVSGNRETAVANERVEVIDVEGRGLLIPR